MSPTVPFDNLIFDSVPLRLLRLCEEVFPNSEISVAILPLSRLESQHTTTLQPWLHSKEISQHRNFSLEKRSREWLGGRICAKQSANNFFLDTKNPLFPPEFQQYRVQSEESGRPYFSTNYNLDFRFPELSISHSKGYATAMSSICFCGIDIQYTASTLSRVQEKFCTPHESRILEEQLPKLSPISRLTSLWSAKEAAKKMLSPGGIPGFHELKLYALHDHGENNYVLSFSTTNGTPSLQVATTMFNKNYALAICCTQSGRKIH
jgi:phosphopantetheinyl transferase